jgi:hypothetical protein
MALLAWSLTIAAAIHIFEEFVFPGGFKEWWRAYQPETAGSVSNRFLIFINVVLILFSVTVALAVQAPRGNGMAAWLALATLLFSNAIFHLVGAFRTKRYSPGMVSGIALYIPLAIYGYVYFVGGGKVSILTAIVAALIGSSYHFISFTRHRRRTRVAAAKA